MPKEGISIYFSIEDGGTAVLKALGDQTKALDKETQNLARNASALAKANEPLIRRQNELKTAMVAGEQAVRDAKKAFQQLGDETSRTDLSKAIAEYDEMKRELKDVESQIKSNQKTAESYRESLRKAGTENGGTEGTSLTSLARGLAAGQVGKEFASSLGGLLSANLSSAIGVPEASTLSNILSGALSGAAAGSAAGPLGALLGSVAGVVSGAFSSATEIYTAKDEAFKEYYAGLYDEVDAATSDMISAGSATAGSREQTRKAFSKRLGGDEAADAYLDRVETMAARTNYGYDEITGYSQSLLNTYSPDEVFGVLQSLSDATAGLDLSSSDVSMMISGLSRMRTTGKATQEYLNYFSERGVDVYAALGEALGVDKSQIAGMVTKGQIGGSTAAEAILDYIDRTYGGLSEDLMTTYDALKDNLEDIMTTVEAAGGEGYNEMRKSGLTAEAEAYSGALGDAVQEINRIAGENQAYLENLSEQYTREALGAVLLGEGTSLFSAEDQEKLSGMAAAYEEAAAEYAGGSQEAGLKMESLREQAEALAKAAYESSGQYQTLMDTQLDEITAIRENTAGLEAATNAYRLSHEESKGEGATWLGGSAKLETAQSVLSLANAVETGSVWSLYAGKGYAYGLDRVPYDDYPALLHEGERVLTAQEARTADEGGRIVQITVTGNSFMGSVEEMADQLADVLARKLEGASVLAVPR